MDENLESNPLYKDVKDYLTKVSASKSQTPSSNKKWSVKSILFVAIPILISLLVITVIFKPPGVLKNLFTGKHVLVVDVRDVSDVSDVSESISKVIMRHSQGRILDIKQTPTGLQLTTDIKGAEDITITQDTDVGFLTRKIEGGYTQGTHATLEDLEIGKEIRIRLIYSPRTGTWSIKKVNIIESI